MNEEMQAKKGEGVTPGDIDLQNQDFYLKYAVWGWLGDSTGAQRFGWKSHFQDTKQATTVCPFVFSGDGGGWQGEMRARSRAFTPQVAADSVQGPGVRLGETVLFDKPGCLSPVLR